MYLKRGKKEKNTFLLLFFLLYDSAINIHIISYLLTKKEKKGEIFFVFFV